MPRLDEFHGKRHTAFDIQRRAIETHAGARVLRSQADHHSAPTPSAFMAAIVSATNGFQLRMPT